VPESAGKDFFAIAESQRAVRLFHPDPVPDALIQRLLRTATCAPNGSNRQTWRFLVITDPEKRAAVGKLYLESLLANMARPDYRAERDMRYADRFVANLALPVEQRTADPEAVASVTMRESYRLAESFGEAPVHLVICDLPRRGLVYIPGASIYPAVQNLMLAAWALGLGTVLTTIWRHREEALRALLAIPDEYEIAALIPMGWPARAYGPPRRQPVAEVAFRDTWGRRFAPEETPDRPSR
jgi:nitroreductase